MLRHKKRDKKVISYRSGRLQKNESRRDKACDEVGIERLSKVQEQKTITNHVGKLDQKQMIRGGGLSHWANARGKQ